MIGVASEPRDKYTHVVVFDQPVRLLKVLNEEAKAYMTDLPAYDAARTAKRIRSAGRSFGITDGAKDFLKEITQ